MPGGRPSINLTPYRADILTQLRAHRSCKAIAAHLQATYNVRVSSMTVRRYLASLEKASLRVQHVQGVQQGRKTHLREEEEEEDGSEQVDVEDVQEDVQEQGGDGELERRLVGHGQGQKMDARRTLPDTNGDMEEEEEEAFDASEIRLLRRSRRETTDTPEVREVIEQAYTRYGLTDEQIVDFFERVGIKMGRRGLAALRRRMGMYRRVNGAK